MASISGVKECVISDVINCSDSNKITNTEESFEYAVPVKLEITDNNCSNGFNKTCLLSQEKLDRSSPELWPEQIPGVSEFAALASPLPSESPQPEWLKDLDQEDINMLQDFSSLTAAQLLEKVKDLQNLAYQLGLQEAREMTRGKFLNILDRSSRRRR